ncbi:MAG: hypothetical protein ACE5E5_04485 [Phycisphaerae bacterium]
MSVAAVGLIAFSALNARAADLNVVPVNASGVEGTDWMMGPGANEITLFSGGQDVAIEIFIENLGADNVAAYQSAQDCNYAFSISGSIDPYAAECPTAGLPFDSGACLGADGSRPDWILASSAATIIACSTTALCPDGISGKFICGAVVIAGAAGSGAGPFYASTFGFAVSGDAKGSATVGLDPDPTATLIRDSAGKEVVINSVTAATITVETGSCCGVAGAPLQCLADATAGECAAAGGAFTAGGTCSGVEGPVPGLDSNCPTCDDAIPDEIECNDNNACTVDTCGANGCENTDTTPAGQCCAPTNGALTQIDDGDPCTDDICNADGTVSHPAAAAGTACDDTLQCTANDVCDGAGGCAGTDINTIACPSGDPATDCPAAAQSCAAGLCVCSTTTQMTLGGANVCTAAGAPVDITVDIGDGSACVTGGQFLVQYDPSCIQFEGISSSDQWPLVLFQEIDEVNGLVFAAVGIAPGGTCTIAGTLATLNFTKLDGCGSCNLCYDSINPANTILTDDVGNSVDIQTNCSGTISLLGTVGLNTPDTVSVNPDCDTASATVTWGPITATDSCGTASVACSAFHSQGVNIDNLIAGGGLFPQGLSTFSCTATSDDCGNSVTQSWTVEVTDQHSLDVEVQLSPIVVGDPLDRCICFDFYSDCVQAPNQFCQSLTFGFPFDFTGKSTAHLSVPKGQFACITAKDPLHTLRSVSGIDCVGNTLVAEFKGDPTFNGNWLVNGNLDAWKADGNGDTIDILDFGMFVSQFNQSLDPNSPCGTQGPHSDINGDGVVDGADFTFISQNFLDNSKNSCCATGGGASSTPETPIVSITVKELRRRGLGSLVVADLNGDQVVDQTDMVLFMQGQVPVRDSKRGGSSNADRGSLGR